MLARTTCQQPNQQKNIIAAQLFANSLFNPLPDKFLKNPIQYLEKLRGHGSSIFLYRIARAYNGLIQMSQEKIAKDLNIPIRTIRRWDEFFIQNGFYLKKQTSMFSRNHFYFHPKLQGSLGYKIRKNYDLVEEDLKVMDVKVTALIEFKLRDIYISQLQLPAVAESGRVEVKEDEMDEQRKRLILSKRNHPKAKEALANPEIKKTFLPDVIFGLCRTLDWREEKQVRLAAFDDKVLEDTHNELVLELLNRDSNLKNKFAWFVSNCKKLSASRKLAPMWSFSHMLAENWGIDITSHNFTQDSKKTKSQDSSLDVIKSSAERYAESKNESKLVDSLGLRIAEAEKARKTQLKLYEQMVYMGVDKINPQRAQSYLDCANHWQKIIDDLKANGLSTPEQEIVKIETHRQSPARANLVKLIGLQAVENIENKMIENLKAKSLHSFLSGGS